MRHLLTIEQSAVGVCRTWSTCKLVTMMALLEDTIIEWPTVSIPEMDNTLFITEREGHTKRYGTIPIQRALNYPPCHSPKLLTELGTKPHNFSDYVDRLSYQALDFNFRRSLPKIHAAVRQGLDRISFPGGLWLWLEMTPLLLLTFTIQLPTMENDQARFCHGHPGKADITKEF